MVDVFTPVVATRETFGGQRLSTGRVIWMRVGPAIVTGIVQEIQADGTFAAYTPGSSAPQGLLGFFEARTEVDLANMPDLHWTWPVRV